MAELDKVIKGLEHCIIKSDCLADKSCDECPYHGSVYCANTMKTDALELIKEQANTINTQVGIISLQKQQIEMSLCELQVVSNKLR